MSRICIKCHKPHDTVLQCMMTEQVVDELKVCYDCLMKGSFVTNILDKKLHIYENDTKIKFEKYNEPYIVIKSTPQGEIFEPQENKNA